MSNVSLATLPSLPSLPSVKNPSVGGGSSLKKDVKANTNTLKTSSAVKTLQSSGNNTLTEPIKKVNPDVNVRGSTKSLDDQIARKKSFELSSSESNQSSASEAKTAKPSKQNANKSQNEEASYASSESSTSGVTRTAQDSITLLRLKDAQERLDQTVKSKEKNGLSRGNQVEEAKKEGTNFIQEFKDNEKISGFQEVNSQRKEITREKEKSIDGNNQKRRELTQNQLQEQVDESVDKKEGKEEEVQIRQFERAKGQVFQRTGLVKNVAEIAAQTKRVEERQLTEQSRLKRTFQIEEKLAKVDGRDNADQAAAEQVVNQDRADRNFESSKATQEANSRRVQRQNEANEAASKS